MGLCEEDQKETAELFKEINESYERGDFCDLLVKAKEMRIELPELSEQDIKILEINTKNIKKEIESYKKEISWVWCTTTCPLVKERIKKVIRKTIQDTIMFDWVMDESDDCSICLDELKKNNTEKRLICGHIFHKGCILSWFSIKFTCPLCRLSFE